MFDYHELQEAYEEAAEHLESCATEAGDSMTASEKRAFREVARRILRNAARVKPPDSTPRQK